MPITEFATLQLIPPYTIRSPGVLEFLKNVSTCQSAFATFPVYYFSDVTDPSIIHLIAGWSSVDNHMEWIKSDANQELLKLAVPYLKVLGLLHVEVDFDAISAQKADLLVIEKYEGKDEQLNLPGATRTWAGVGKTLDAGHEGVCYRFSTYDGQTVVSYGKGDSITVMKRLHIANES